MRVASFCGGPVIFTEKFILSLSFPSFSVWVLALHFLLQGGASRAPEVSSWWAGEFGHGGPSRWGLCEAQRILQSLHWRGSETGQVRSGTAVRFNISCVLLTLYKSSLFTKYFTFYFYGRKIMENVNFDVNRPEFKSSFSSQVTLDCIASVFPLIK